MYCVIGDKILKCEIVEKQEAYAWCKIGTAKQNKSIPSTKLFETEQQAQKYIKDRNRKKGQEASRIQDEVNACKKIYDDFKEETGIEVRVIDRRFREAEARRQVNRLRKNKLQGITEQPEETPKKKVYSAKKSAARKGSDKKFLDRKESDKRFSDRKDSDKRFSDKKGSDKKFTDKKDSGKRFSDKKSTMHRK